MSHHEKFRGNFLHTLEVLGKRPKGRELGNFEIWEGSKHFLECVVIRGDAINGGVGKWFARLQIFKLGELIKDMKYSKS